MADNCIDHAGRQSGVASASVLDRAPSAVLLVHSCSPALSPHVEWAVAAELGVPVRLEWTPQPVAPGVLRTECSWRAAAGTAGRVASALRPWRLLRFEVTEAPSPGCDGTRFAHTPSLGMFAATVSANGDVVVGEDRLRALLAASGPQGFAHAVRRELGAAWDDELEPYRCAGDGAAVTWLHRVG